MYSFSEKTVSSAEYRITASYIGTRKSEGYDFKRVDESSIHIPNRGLAWSVSFSPEDSEAKQKLIEAVHEYNAYLDMLDGIEGFKEYFIEL